MNVNELFTRKNLKVLKLINKEELHIRELAERLGVSPGTVHKLVKTLKENNLIVETKVKNKLLIKFNHDNPLVDQVMEVIEQKKASSKVEELKHLLKRRWYIQSFNATPVLIHIGGMSIPIMKKDLGYSYRGFMNDFKDDFCEMYYDRDDLHNIAHEIEDRQNVDSNYIHRLISIWKKDVEKCCLFLKNIKKILQ